jgi:signal transduction histidine kinase
MTLRARLFLTGLAVALPLALALFFIDERFRLAAMEENLRASLRDEARLREDCERPGLEGPPPGFGPPPGGRRGRGPGRGGPPVFTYSAEGVSGRPDAPALPTAQVSTYWAGDGRGVQIRFDIGGEGNCAIGLARMPPREGQLRDQLTALALTIFSVLAAAFLAAGPVISKMRRLAVNVKQSAASKYEQPVPVEGKDEVASLAAAFNDAGASVRAHVLDVQAREETLRQFVANTTHDVAVPLTVLQGHLAEIDQRVGGETSQAALKEAHYMASLLRNLSVATKLGAASAPLAIGPVDLSALVERVIERHRPIARASNVELNFAAPDPALVITTDATLFEQAVSNLTDNAIRYNRPGGHVAVVLDRSGENGFTLSVTDDGPGVGEDELAKLTTRWFRGSDARTRRPDGSGLGLAITAEAVDRLGMELHFARPESGGLRAQIATRWGS